MRGLIARRTCGQPVQNEKEPYFPCDDPPIPPANHNHIRNKFRFRGTPVADISSSPFLQVLDGKKPDKNTHLADAPSRATPTRVS